MDDKGEVWTPGPMALRAATLIALAGLFLFLWRIGDPAQLNFDESFYVPAARVMNALEHPTNLEHPLLGKYLIGWSIRLFGDTPGGWRVMSALFGAITLFATVMGACWALRSVRAGAMAGALVLLGQMLFVLARAALLDVFLAGFLALAFWMIAAATVAQRGNRRRIAFAGLFFGLAAGCKWTAFPLLIIVGVGLAICRAVGVIGKRKGVMAWAVGRDMGPIRGVSTVEAFLWLGPFAAIVYLATFTPALFYAVDPLALSDLIAFQFRILDIQQGSMAPHPYQSLPWQWVLDLRPIWFFYEPVEGVQRGVLLLGNPVVMWAGGIAVPVALVIGVRRRGWGLTGAAGLYLVALGIWLIIPKPVMFYHHYLVPSLFLCVALAGVLDELWLKRGRRELPIALLAAAMLGFWHFYPILSAAPLSGPQAFSHWMWLNSWR